MLRKITICFLVTIGGLTTLLAQEEESSWAVSCDIYSSYVWRGTQFGTAPSIQLGISYTSGSLTVGAWGAHQFGDGSGTENDLYLSYDVGVASFTLTDYYFGTPDFDSFDADAGAHFIEASVSGKIAGIGYTVGS